MEAYYIRLSDRLTFGANRNIQHFMPFYRRQNPDMTHSKISGRINS